MAKKIENTLYTLSLNIADRKSYSVRETPGNIIYGDKEKDPMGGLWMAKGKLHKFQGGAYVQNNRVLMSDERSAYYVAKYNMTRHPYSAPKKKEPAPTVAPVAAE